MWAADGRAERRSRQADQAAVSRGGGAALATGFGGALSQFACSDAQAEADPGDTLYAGGTVLTMTDASPTSEAVLVRGKMLGGGGGKPGRRSERSILPARHCFRDFSIRTVMSS